MSSKDVQYITETSRRQIYGVICLDLTEGRKHLTVVVVLKNNVDQMTNKMIFYTAVTYWRLLSLNSDLWSGRNAAAASHSFLYDSLHDRLTQSLLMDSWRCRSRLDLLILGNELSSRMIDDFVQKPLALSEFRPTCQFWTSLDRGETHENDFMIAAQWELPHWNHVDAHNMNELTLYVTPTVNMLLHALHC